jgi:ring-1,2-phenylacetyl-CoA epoxidase subunit PaaE
MAFGFFKKKQKDTTDNRYTTLKIREVVPIAKEAVNLIFEKPEEDFNYQPGQFITLIDEVNGEKIRRAYSLCTSPFLDEYPAVTVKRVPNGRMSNHINSTYKAGQEVEVMKPMGMFTTTFDAQATRKAVFFGGGSGITPLMSLMRTILAKEPNSNVTLIYGNRSEEYIIFKDLLNELMSQYSGRFQVIHILEEDPNGLAAIKGRPSPGIISDLISSREHVGGEYYICGPQPMMDVTMEGLKLAGVNESSIRMESFEAGKTSPKEIIDTPTASSGVSEVTILLDGEEYVVPVKRSNAILEIAMDQGLDMPYSCQSGLCTACRGKCTEGDISIDDAEGLSQAELDEGYRLLCIGKPLTEKVRVEIG